MDPAEIKSILKECHTAIPGDGKSFKLPQSMTSVELAESIQNGFGMCTAWEFDHRVIVGEKRSLCTLLHLFAFRDGKTKRCSIVEVSAGESVKKITPLFTDVPSHKREIISMLNTGKWKAVPGTSVSTIGMALLLPAADYVDLFRTPPKVGKAKSMK